MVKKDVVRIVKTFLNFLEEKGVEVTAAYIYGSYSKGTPTSHSDFDVAIVSDNFTGNPLKDIKIIFQALKQADSRIEPVYFHPKDFRDEDPLVWEIKKNGIKIR